MATQTLTTTPDVAGNQAAAAKLGVTIPGVGGGGASSLPTSSSVPTRTLYDPNNATALSNSLNSNFENSNQYTGILDRYNAAQGATSANTQATGNYIQSVVGGNTDYEKLQTGIQKQSALEGRQGFATNVAMLSNLQKQGDFRVKQLTDQANQALMANNAQGAAALSDLAVKEQSAITDARTQFLSNYFNSQAESRAQASFQTPEQQAVLSLAQQYPGAGISPSDSLDVVQQKISSSPLYQANLGKAQQDIETAKAQAQAALTGARASLMSAGAAQTAAGAQAGLAGAQAAQTRYLTNLYQGGGGGNFDTDVNALLGKTLTPQQLQDKYSSIPSGGLIVKNILDQAQQKGYDVNAGTLTGNAQATQTNVMNSGNIPNMIGLGLSNAFNASSKSLYNATGGNSNTVQYNGQNYTFPSAAAAASFKKELGI